MSVLLALRWLPLLTSIGLIVFSSTVLRSRCPSAAWFFGCGAACVGVGWILRFLLGQAPEGTAFYTPYPLSSNVWLLSVAPDAAFDVFVSVGMILAAIGQSKRSCESKRR